MICAQCKNPDEEVRPYGPKGSWICFPCMKASPELEEECKKNFIAQLNGAAAVSNGIVVIGESTGPRPLNSNSLV
jgi:recombinational DNA repair protein (RecF pathway)